MRRKSIHATNTLALSWCAAVMVVLGAWLPPMMEAPEPPRVALYKS